METKVSDTRRFERHRRLTKSAQYREVFSGNQRVADQWFTVLFRQQPQGETPRLGLAIAKKSVPRSVDRSRIKRLVRESFRTHRQDMPVVDIVIMARRGCADADNRQLHRSLQRLWKKMASRCKN
ncbi:ribonuclease P protein component [Granulosicoccaceae sp. 1_MG-2023]|nr:ribonuclease P protein component [Granulosicoccaceae sp. 1_MG-2023]